jgi:hypothetical protein
MGRMRWGRIAGGDNLFRHCIHPLSFKGPRFASDKLIKIYDESDGSLLASLVWERFVPTPTLLHGYGCRLALGMNDRARSEGTYRERNRRIYCGAYQLRADAVRALTVTEGLNEIVSADVVHHIEEGEIAHADLRIVLRLGDDFDIESTKTAIVDRLWNACRGPLKHVCDHDKETNPHPSSMLSAAPGGAYSDTRSHPLRFWFIVRYRICNWLWRTFFKNTN